ncbi:hypothetical protein SAMN05444166_5451 [Singulisphaera sp. GP187]|uniref:hypothetical protein n=1 Tax=Singulisphaera sp. GP187 TaxID=1882752 RepID=UPI000925C5CF|nr:hypothetical protein [Singulisphaera sp. GP187]SIO57636.1 hypothetical protein SAMN05444166_5451 [Singulisphaera sp. GP187]
MPRQNRVTPFGEIIATPERGTYLGNRGLLHDAAGRVRRPWQVKRWILCRLEFRERRRVIMAPGRYTELFFLDEATGLAAGHRPCFECRRNWFAAFREAWATANPGAGPPTAASIDERLHAERVGPGRLKPTYRAALDDLPDGVLVTRDEGSDIAYLLWERHLLAWSPGGYTRRRSRRDGEEVTVLTPRSTVGAIRAGYVPEIHPSTQGLWAT